MERVVKYDKDASHKACGYLWALTSSGDEDEHSLVMVCTFRGGARQAFFMPLGHFPPFLNLKNVKKKKRLEKRKKNPTRPRACAVKTEEVRCGMMCCDVVWCDASFYM